ncbi:hypothetical protein K504DRAFT_496384 [Pleomassaria siparia CBS 279.74]|uniref:non-specific serine/threonine protein kinase n=1 Tax=Pleomassaria siparia CBS 279.74 TaxID=1314801 RepID=A0A6G1KPY3_9PLEO|nr:hypothetical protein K504DRAFT_496384 [Pleomassaria siparia CBS 279.74]
MPPKQVYGKRTKTAGAGYAKFLSPDKSLVSRDKVAKNGKLISKDGISDAVDLERQLETLTLKEEDDSKSVARKGCRDPADDVERDRTASTISSDKLKHKRKPQAKDPRSDIADLDEQLKSLTIEKKNTPRIPTKHVKNRAETTVDQTATQCHADVPIPSTPVQTARAKSKNKTELMTQPVMPLLPTPSPTPIPEDIYSAYVAPILSISDMHMVVPFTQWSSELDAHFDVTKFAEASFSEVYRLTTKSGRLGLANESVLKVVALKSPPNAPLPSERRAGDRARKVVDAARQSKNEREHREKEDEWKSHVADVHSEVKLLQNLNHIPGFTHFCEVTVLQGRPSLLFANAWKAWNKSRPRGKKSEFPDPSKKTSFEDTQLWVVIEMQDAGIDLEHMMEAGGVGTIWEVWDVFWGVCLSVAKAEEACRFEHRDLHLENICIKSSRPNSDSMKPFIRDPCKRKLGFSGLETTVIDYTLSRADIVSTTKTDSRRTSSSSTTSRLSTTSTSSVANSQHVSDVAYLDLEKSDGLFEGNAEDEYQYEIYRHMRGVVFNDDPLKQNTDIIEEEPTPCEYTPETPRRSPRKAANAMTARPHSLVRNPHIDIWKRFHPKTNLVWAHFILYKLLEHLEGYEPANISIDDLMANVEANPEEAPKVQKKAMRLYRVLEKVAMMLEPEALGKEGCLGSMKELVVLAIEHRWLGVEDVAGDAE